MSDYKWKKENTVFVSMNLNKNTDADIISAMVGKNKQAFFKNAIRYYIANGCPEPAKEKEGDQK